MGLEQQYRDTSNVDFAHNPIGIVQQIPFHIFVVKCFFSLRLRGFA